MAAEGLRNVYPRQYLPAYYPATPTNLVPVREGFGGRRRQPDCVCGAQERYVEPESEAVHHTALEDVELQGDLCGGGGVNNYVFF